MSEKDSLNYARFWPRMNAGVAEFLFFSCLFYFAASLFAAVVNHAPPVLSLVVSGAGVVSYIAYRVMRKKYGHLRVVDRDGDKPRFLVWAFRKILLFLPLLIYIMPLAYIMAEIIATSYAGAKGLPVLEIISGAAADHIQLICMSGIFWLFWFVVPVILSPQHKSLPDYIFFTAVTAPKENDLPKGAIACAAGTGRIVAGFFSTAFILCQIYLGAFLVYNHADRPRNPDAAALLKNAAPAFDPQDNFYAALRSINAPAVSGDRYAYGLKSLQGATPARLPAGVEEFEEVHWQGTDNFNDCFQPGAFYTQDCPGTDRLEKAYAANRQLLTRYQKLYHRVFSNYTRTYRPGETEAYADIVNMQRFLGLYWQALARSDRGEEALEDWMANNRFLRAALAQKRGFLEREFWNTLYGLNQNALLPVLTAAPQLLEKHGADILAALHQSTAWNWDISGSLQPEFVAARAVFKTMDGQALFNLNDSYNALYDLAQDIKAVKPTSRRTVFDAVQRIQRKYDCNLTNLPLEPLVSKCTYNPLGRFYVFSVANRTDTILSQYPLMALAQAEILWIQARQNKVTADEMPDFLAKQGKNMNDPLTDAPFVWNKETHCFEHDKQPGACFVKYPE
jgi:hypothetical protein